MTDRIHREQDRLRAERATLHDAAAVIRRAPDTTTWAVLSDPATAEGLASILDVVAERLEWMPEQDRRLVVRVAAELCGRRMDRPTVRRTRRR